MARACVPIPSSRGFGELEVESRVSLFIAFAVYMGNLKRERAPRTRQTDLIAGWNGELSLVDREIAFIDYFRHTGNYVLKVSNQYSVEYLLQILFEHIKEDFSVFRYVEFVTLVGSPALALRDKPTPVPGRRWTPGLVMDLNPVGTIPRLPRPESPLVVFGSFAKPRVRVAWKADALNPDGETLDRDRRDGGWGSLATQTRNEFGGMWTARAMSAVEGLIGRAHIYETRSV